MQLSQQFSRNEGQADSGGLFWNALKRGTRKRHQRRRSATRHRGNVAAVLAVERMEDRILLSGGPGVDYVDGEILVGLKDGYSAEDLSAVLPAGYAISSTGSHGLVVLDLPSATTVNSAITTWDGHYMLKYAEPNHIAHFSATAPNETDFVNQWAHRNTGQPVNGITGTSDADIDSDLAWDTITDASSVIVAVLDSGIDVLHGDLAGNIWVNSGEVAGDLIDNDGNGFVDDYNGFDFDNNNGDISDTDGHGTFVSGMIGAQGNNSIGLAGVAWDVQLMGLAVSTSAAVIDAIDYAIDMGADVINASFMVGNSTPLEDAFERARDAGVIVVAAAGNGAWDGTKFVGYDIDANNVFPASYTFDNIISVASTDQFDAISVFSNFGDSGVDLAAPGENVRSTLPRDGMGNDQYGYWQGTSFSAPLVSGSVALLKALSPGAHYSQIIDAIVNNVDTLASLSGKVASGGRLNVHSAVESFTARVVSTVFDDANRNGKFDGGESGVDGVTVNLYWVGDDGSIGGGDDVLVDTELTQGPGPLYGAANFLNVPYGTYYIEVVQPAGKAFTFRDAVGDTQDSDVGLDGISSTFTVDSSDSLHVETDAGLQNVTAGTGRAVPTVFDDSNRNGLFGGGEAGISGIDVELYWVGADDVIGGTDDILVDTQTTQGAGPLLGAADFTNLPYGTFYYKVDQPSGKAFTFRDVSGDTLDSDVSLDGISSTFELDGNDALHVETDAGLQSVSAGTGRAVPTVFDDANEDGVFSAGETGISGVGVELFWAGTDGDVGGGDDILVDAQTTQGPGPLFGAANFINLPYGTYFYKVSRPTGKAFTFRGVGGSTLDSDVDLNGFSSTFVLDDSDALHVETDAGLQDVSAGTGRAVLTVFDDANSNGIFGAGETGISGVTVNLYWTGADDSFGGGDDILVDTQLTQGPGSLYGAANFTLLAYGTYYYEVVLPSGKVFSPRDVGGDTTDSDVDSSGISSLFTLSSGDTLHIETDAGLIDV